MKLLVVIKVDGFDTDRFFVEPESNHPEAAFHVARMEVEKRLEGVRLDPDRIEVCVEEVD